MTNTQPNETLSEQIKREMKDFDANKAKERRERFLYKHEREIKGIKFYLSIGLKAKEIADNLNITVTKYVSLKNRMREHDIELAPAKVGRPRKVKVDTSAPTVS